MTMKGVVLLITLITVSATQSSGGKKDVPAKSQSDDYLLLYLVGQVYVIKPKVASLETTINNMQLKLKREKKENKAKVASLEGTILNMQRTINLQKKHIEALQNRKVFRCETGKVEHHDVPAPNWPYEISVKFKTPFQTAPKVTHGVTLIDSSHQTHLRLNTAVQSVTNKGFKAFLGSWAETVLYGAHINWMACRY